MKKPPLKILAGTIATLLAGNVARAQTYQAYDGEHWVGTGGTSEWFNIYNWTDYYVTSPNYGLPPNNPGPGFTAWFDNPGSANVVIDLGSGGNAAAGLINFARDNANNTNPAAYTIGSGGAGAQTLTIDASGSLPLISVPGVTMASNVANNQLFNASIVLRTVVLYDSVGNPIGATNAFTFSNNSTTNTLTFAGGITNGYDTVNITANPSPTALTVTGAGNTIINGIIADGTFTDSNNITSPQQIVLVKNGNGTLTLGGANTYTGTTTVNAGTLQVNGSLAAGSQVNVGSAGTLAGSGTINGNVNLTGSGIINLSSGTIGGKLAITGGNWNGTGTVTGLVTSSSGTLNIGAAGNMIATAGLNVTGGTFAAAGANAKLTGSLTYSSSSSSTFNGIIADTVTPVASNTVTLAGSGALTLAGANTYTGATTVKTGTLLISGSLNGTTGTPLTFAGNTVNIGTASDTAGGTVTITTSAPHGLAVGSKIALSGVGVAGYNGNFVVTAVPSPTQFQYSAAGSLSNSSGGTAIAPLTGTETFNLSRSAAGTQGMGALNVTQGEAIVQSTFVSGSTGLTFSSLASRTAGTALNFVVSGGTNGSTNSINLTAVSAGFINKGTYFNGADFAAMNATGTYARALAYGTDANAAALNTITASNHVKLTATPGSRAGDTLLSLNLSGSGAGYTMSSGTLTVPAILKSGGGSAGTISGGDSITTAGNAELVIRTDTSSDQLTISTLLAGFSGGLTKSGAGTLTLSAVANTYTGPTTILAGTLQLGTGTGGQDGSISSSSNIVDNSGLLYNLAGASSYSGVISGSGILTKQGAGTITLGGNNSYTGSTTITAGSLQVGINNALPITTSVTLSSGTFDVNGFAQTIGSLSGGGAVTLGAGGVLTIGDSTSTSFSGTMTGTGASGLTKQGAGTLTIANTLGYSGPTLITNGTLTDGVTNALPTTTALTLANATGATLNLNGNNQTIGSLAGTGIVTLGGGTLTVGNSSNTQFDGTISGSGGLTKTGSGTLTLTNAVAYTGPTTVTQGTLQVNGTLASTSLINVPTGTTLGLGPLPSGATASVAASVTVTGGTLNLAGTLATGTTLTLSSGTVNSVGAGGTAATVSLPVTGTTPVLNAPVNTELTVTKKLLANNGGTVVTAGAFPFKVGGTNVVNNMDRLILQGGTTTIDILQSSITSGLDVRGWTSQNGAVDGSLFAYNGSTLAGQIGSSTISTFAGTIGYATSSIHYNNQTEYFSYGSGSGVDLNWYSTHTAPTGYDHHFTVEYRGLLLIPSTGYYTFSTTSDDGSAMWINTSLANPDLSTATINNGGDHGSSQVNSSPIYLTGNTYYTIVERFYENGGGRNNFVQWDPSGGTNFQDIPGSIFYHGGISSFAINLPNTNLTVTPNPANPATSGSILKANFAGTATLGDLTINSGTLSFQTATAMSFNTITANDDSEITSGIPVGLRNATVNVASGKTLTMSAQLANVTGTTNVTKTGPGTLLMNANGTNTYTGVTTIANGTLSITNAVVIGSRSDLGNATSPVVVGDATNKGTLSYNGNTANFTRGFTIQAGGGEIDNNTVGALLAMGGGNGITAANGANTSLTIGGDGDATIVTGVNLGSTSGALTKTGAGILKIISGAQTYKTLTTTAGAGPTTVSTALASGTTVNANANISFTSASQTLGALSIGDGVTVTFDSGSGSGQTLATAYYLGTLPVSPGTWSATDGVASNWSTDSGGLIGTPLTPVASTNVILSASLAGNQGSMTLGANMAVNSITVNDTADLTLLPTGGYSLTIGSAASPGILINGGAGNVTLNPAIKLGVAQSWINNAFTTLTVGGAVDNRGFLLTVDGTGPTIINGAISGSGGLVKTGTGSLTLGGVSTYTGPTTISRGSISTNADSTLTGGPLGFNSAVSLAAISGVNLFITNNVSIGSLTGGSGTFGKVTITTGKTLTVGGDNTSPAAFAGIIADTAASPGGALTKVGTGTLTLSGTNTYRGVTNVTGGTLQVNSPGSLNAASQVNVGTAGTLAGSGTVNGNATLTGNGVINLSGGTIGGTLTVTGGNWNGSGSVTGLVTSGSGTLTIGSGANLTANGGLAVTGGTFASTDGTSTITGSVNYTSAAPGTFGGVLAGANKTLTLNSAGNTLTLTGPSTYTGATTVTAGTLTLASGASLGNTPITVNSSATLAVNPGFSAISAGTTGLGSAGATLTLLAGSTFSMASTIGTFNLQQNNSFGSAGLVASVASGTAPVLNFAIGTDGINSTIPVVNVTNGVTTNLGVPGVVNFLPISGLTSLTPGDYTFMTGASGLGSSAFTLGTTTLTVGGIIYDLTLTNSTSIAEKVSIKGRNVWSNSSPLVGDGYWSTANNWLSGAVPNGAGVLAYFTQTYLGNTTGPIVLNGSKTIGQIVLNTNTATGYTVGLSADTTSLLILNNSGNNASVNVVSGTQTIAAPVELDSDTLVSVSVANSSDALTMSGNITQSGTHSLTKNGPGTLTLSGTNSYSGGTNINLGTLALSGSGTLGASGSPLTMGGGALDLGALSRTAGAVTITAAANSGDTIRNGSLTGTSYAASNAGGNAVISANLLASGAAGLTKSGAGTLTLAGSNTYTGVTTISGGVLTTGASGIFANGGVASAIGQASNAAASLVLDGGTLQYANTGAAESTDRLFTLTQNGGSLDASGTNAVSFLGNESGPANAIASMGSGARTLTLTGANTGANSFAPIVANGPGGTTALLKTGTGAWIVTGNNTYSGLTTISAGTLKLGAAGDGTNTPLGTVAAGTVVSATGAALDLNGFTLSTAEALTLNGTGVSSGGALTNSSATPAIYSGLITLGSASSIVASSGNIILSNTGTITGATFGLTLDGTAPGSSLAGIIGTTSGTLTKNGTGTWTLSGASTYTGATTVNAGTLKAGVAANAFGNNSAVIMTNAAGTILDITGFNTQIGSLTGGGASGGNVTLGSATLTVGGDNTSPAAYAGVISGTGGALTKIGTGTLTLSGADIYTGPTTVSSGTLSLTGSLTGSSVTTSGSGIVSEGPTGVIAGAGTTFTQGSSGTTILAGANTYTGATTVNAGTLQAGVASVANVSGAFGNNSAVVMGNFAGAALSLNGFNTQIGSLTGGGLSGGNVTLGSATLAVGGDNTSPGAYAGVISGTGALTKIGSGTLTLSGSDTYTGVTTISGGILSTGANGIFANGGVASAIGQSSNAAGNLVLNGGTLQYANTGTAESADRLFTLTQNGGSLDASGTNAISFIGNGAGSANAIAYTGSGARTLTLTGTNIGANTLTAILADGTGGATSLSKTGAGSWTLTAVNTYTGVTTISGGILSTGASGIFAYGGTASAIGQSSNAAANLVLDGGTLQYANTVFAAITDRLFTLTQYGGGLDASGTGSNTVSFVGNGAGLANAIAYTGSGARTLTLTGANTGANTFAPIVADGTGGLTGLTKSGAGTWKLTAGNTYTGATTVNAGTLQAGVASVANTSGAFGNNSAVIMANAAATVLNITGFNTQIGSLTGGGTTGGNVTLGAATLTVGGDNTSPAAYAGVISGTGALTKIGSGTLTLSGVSTYTGATTVSGGTLVLAPTTTLASTLANTAISVASGATFAARPGSSSVSAGATVPLSKGASLTLNAGSAFTMVDNAIGTFNLKQGGAFGSAGLVASVASGSAPTLSFDLGNGTIDVLNVTLGVTTNLGVPGVVNFVPVSGLTSLTPGPYTFMTAASGLGPTAFSLGTTTLTVGSNTYALSISASTATAEVLTIGVAGGIWTNSTTNYSWASSANWNTGVIPQNAGDVASFTQTGLGVVQLNGSKTLGQLLLNTTTGGYTIGLSADPSSLLILNNNGASANVNVVSGTHTIAAPVQLASDTVITLANGSATLNVTGSITQTGTRILTTNGPGTLTLSAVNSYSGGTNINSGTLALSGSGTLGAAASAVSLGGGALDLGTLSQTVGAVTITAAAASGDTIKNGTLSGTSYAASNTSGIAVISANLANGSAGLTKTGAGTLTLAGANTYSGTTTISGGVLSTGAAGIFANGGVASAIGQSSNAAGNLVLDGGTLQYANTGAAETTDRLFTLTQNGGTLDASGTNAISFNGNGAGAANAIAYTGSGARTLTLTGANIAANTLASMLANGSGGATAVIKTGVGSWTLTGANTYTGATTVNAGTLQAGVASVANVSGAFGNNSAVIMGTAAGAALNLNGFNTQVGSLTGGGASGGNVTLGSATLAVGGDNTSPAAYVGVISGTGALTKIGSGTLTLSGNNTYSGLTTISAGTLKLGAAGDGTNTPLGTVAAGTVVAATGAALDLNGITLSTAEALTLNGTGVSSGGALTNSSATAATYSGLVTLGSDSSIVASSGSISLSNAGTMTGAYGLTLDGTATGSSLARPIGTASVTKNGAGTWTLSGANTYPGTTTVNAGILQAGSPTAFGPASSASLVFGAASTAKVQLNGNSMTVIGLNTNATPGAPIVESGSGTAGTDTLTVNNPVDGTFAGVLQNGSTRLLALTKGGSAILTLSGANTYTGATTVSSGTLSLTGSLTGSNVTTNGSGIVSEGSTGVIAGAGVTFTQGSSGTTLLAGANTYTGSTTVNAGTLQAGVVSAGNTSGAFGNNSAVIMGNFAGAALNLNGFNTQIGSLTGGGASGGNVTLGSATLTVGGDNTSPAAYAGVVSGTGALTKIGSGTLTLSGNNTYGGLTTISAGTLKLGAAGGGSNAPLGTTAAGTLVSATGAALDLNGFTLGTAEALTLNGTGVNSGGALTNSSATAAIYSGLVALGSDSSIVANGGNINLSNVGTITGAYGLTLDGTAAGSSIASIIGTTSGTVTKSGTGTWTLSGASTYTGTTTVNAGMLKAGVITNAFGNNSAVIMGTTAGTLDITGFDTQIGSITGGSAVGGSVTLGAATLAVGGDNTSPATYSGVISGAGALTKTGSGTLTLSGNNSYGGLTTISAGTLKLGAAGGGTNAPLGTTAAGTVVSATGAALDLNGFTLGTAEALTLNGTGVSGGGALTNSSATPATYSGLVTLGSASSIIASSGNINLTNTGTITGAYGLTLGGAATGSSLASIIGTTSGTVTKAGSGTWTLSGANTYTGATTVSAGTLKLSAASTNNLSNSTSITISQGATLDVSGLTSQQIALGTGQTLKAIGTGTATIAGTGGVSVGAQTVDLRDTAPTTFTTLQLAQLSAASGANFYFDLNGTGSSVGDLINVTGSGGLTFASGMSIGFNNNPTLAGNYRLFQYTGAAPSFSGVILPTAPPGKTYTLNSNSDPGFIDLNVATGVTATTFTLAASASAANLHLGGSSTITTTITNTGTTGAGSDSLSYTSLGSSVSPTSGTTLGAAAGGGTVAANAGGTANATANQSFTSSNLGPYTFTPSGGTVTNTGLGGTLTPSSITTATVTVYSGLGTWTGANGGSWGTLASGFGANWGTNQGSPGLDAGFAAVDTATFGNTAGSVTVNLNGASPSLNTITFNNTGSYTIVTGTGGVLTLAGSGAGITAAGNHQISANVTLAAGVTLSVTGGGDSLGISGVVGGSQAVIKTGAGTLTLSGANTYNGVTKVIGGILTTGAAGIFANGGVASAIGQSSNAAGNLVLDGGTLQYANIGAAETTDRLFTLTQNGGSLDASGANAISFNSTGAIAYTGSGARILTLTGASTAANTLASILANGTGGATVVAKTGAGSWTLTGANTYSGGTVVSAGTLTGTGATPLGATTGTLTVSNPNTGAGTAVVLNLSTTAATTTGSFSGTIATPSGGANTVTINNGGQLFTVNQTSAGNFAGVIAGSGGFTLGSLSANALTLSGNNTYSGLTTISAGTLKLGAAGDGTNTPLGTVAAGTVVSATGAALDLNGFTLSTAEALTLNGTGVSSGGALTNSSATAATYNGLITLGSASSIVASSGNIILSNTGTITGATFGLTLDGTATGSSLAGIIGTTSGTLTKNGTGTWTLSGASTYTGTTTINAGTLKLGAAGDGTNTPLGTVAAGTVVAATGAALDLNGITLSTAEALTLNGTGVSSGGALTNSSATAATYNGLITLGSASSIVASSGNIILSNTGTITGATFGLTLDGTATGSSLAGIIGTTSGTLTKNGTGTWTLSGASTYTGTTTINAGTLKLGAAGDGTNTPLGTVAAGTVVAATGAALDLNGFTLSTAEALTLNGTGVSSGGALTNSSATAATYSGLVTLGSASSIVASTGNIILSNTGTITGATFGLTLDGTATGSSIASIIGTTNGTVTKTGAGSWTLNAVNTYTGATTLSGGILTTGATGIFANGGVASAIGQSSNAAASLVLNGGTLQYANTGAAESTDRLFTLTQNGGGLDASGTNTISFNGNGVGAANAIAYTGSGARTLTLTGTNTGANTFAPILADGSGGATGLTKSGAGNWKLTAANTYTGPTTVNAGTLQAGVASVAGTSGAFGNNSAVIMANAAATILNITGFSNQIGSLTGGGTTGGNVTLGAATLTVGGDNTSPAAYAGVISGTGALTKIGSGTLTLSGVSTYTGATTVSGGTLVLAPTTTLASTLANTAISVASGATFAARPGSSSVSAGATVPLSKGASLTLNAGSAFTMVDNAIGTFNLKQGGAFGSAGLVASVASGSAPTLSFDLGNGTIDVLNVTLGVTTNLGVPGVVNFVPVSGLTSLTLGDYTFMTAAGGGLGPSAFSLGTTSLTVGSSTYTLSISPTLSNSTTEVLHIALAGGFAPQFQPNSLASFTDPGASQPALNLGTGSVVPEPGTLGLLMVGALGFLNRRRRA